jgi:hypothetical protein
LAATNWKAGPLPPAANRRASANAAAAASARFMPGPASATSIMCSRGLRMLAATTGTGLAQPNTGAPLIASTSGNATVPMGSTWRIGLGLSRPSSLAVGSPNALATQPCEISWSTIAKISGISQVAI